MACGITADLVQVARATLYSQRLLVLPSQFSMPIIVRLIVFLSASRKESVMEIVCGADIQRDL